MNAFIRTFKSVRQLGLKSNALYAVYQLGLRSGYYRRVTPTSLYVPLPEITLENVHWLTHLPGKEQLKPILTEKEKELKNEADEILNNQLRFFGGPPLPFKFESKNNPPLHWSEAETQYVRNNPNDIKLVWEPARFNWVFPLARAYVFFGDETYAKKFWELFLQFTEANPFNSGLNWSSGQEVALRMMALIFGGSVFRNSKSTQPQDLMMLLASIHLHAKRIPPTLIYARSQNNNHLLSEAAGLYWAGSFFKDLPMAQTWKASGWKYFNQAIQQQIADNGEYTQHSLNYHRLMLQIALWMDLMVRKNQETLPALTVQKLRQATEWLLNYIEPSNGLVPNLGHNDGSHIFRLSQSEYSDYRSVAQASAIAFLGKPVMPSGWWDEEPLWLGLTCTRPKIEKFETRHSNRIPWVGNSTFRIYLQAVRFHSRPAHADQLHADIWYKGINLARDAGTYSYNLAPPWQNALSQTAVHNTVSIDGLNQMTPAGKFLWLDWANGSIAEFNPHKNMLQAYQDGYRKLGIIHQRKICLEEKDRLIIEDILTMNRALPSSHYACLHWLLPDWKWELE